MKPILDRFRNVNVIFPNHPLQSSIRVVCTSTSHLWDKAATTQLGVADVHRSDRQRLIGNQPVGWLASWLVGEPASRLLGWSVNWSRCAEQQLREVARPTGQCSSCLPPRSPAMSRCGWGGGRLQRSRSRHVAGEVTPRGIPTRDAAWPRRRIGGAGGGGIADRMAV